MNKTANAIKQEHDLLRELTNALTNKRDELSATIDRIHTEDTELLTSERKYLLGLVMDFQQMISTLSDTILKVREQEFESKHNVKKGDIMDTVTGRKVVYQGFSNEWESVPVKVFNISKKTGRHSTIPKYMTENEFVNS